MKNFVRKLFIGFCIVGALSIFNAQAWGATIGFKPLNDTMSPGDPLQVDIWVSDLGNDEDLSAFDLTVNYDETVLEFKEYTLGSELGDIEWEAMDWSYGENPAERGSIHIAEISWLEDLGFQGDSFTLATLSFTRLQEGEGNLSFSSAILGDTWGNSIDAVPTPEPATLLLLGSGLMGLSRFRRKNKK